MKNQNRRNFLKVLGLGVAGLSTFPFNCCKATKVNHPNIIFILIDDMGYGDAACYGNNFSETPNIDKLAKSGIRFTNAYAAAPNCSPTRASILTGKWPARLGITQYLPGNKNAKRMKNKKLIQPDLPDGLALSEITISEALKKANYATASIGKWHLGGDEYLPERQGFDLNFGGSSAGHHKTMFAPYKTPDIPNAPEGEYLTDRLTKESENFMENNKDQPFFLYLSHYAVHRPIEAKKEKIKKYEEKSKPDKFKKPTFTAMLESVDDSVGRIVEKLEQLSLYNQTVIFFFSDNGGLVRFGADNGPLRKGKGWIYEGGIREPLIISWPDVIKPGIESDKLVSSIDFYPTILEMANLSCESEHQPDGVSLMPILTNRGYINRNTLYWHYPHYSNNGCPPCAAIRKDDFKLIEFFEDGRLELYNLKKDIGETTNLVDIFPEKTAQLFQELKSWRQSLNAKIPSPNPDYDPAKN